MKEDLGRFVGLNEETAKILRNMVLTMNAKRVFEASLPELVEEFVKLGGKPEDLEVYDA